jgi:hypothetical protein
MPFACSQGQAWLVSKDNPGNFQGIHDLLRDDIRFFISNPETEKASHKVYLNTLLSLAQTEGLNTKELAQMISMEEKGILHGRHVHHREAPEAIASGQADASLVYYHLALRYTRIFPDHFELIPLQGSGTPEAANTQETTEYHAGIVDNGGDWGEAFHDFLKKEEAASLYREHGLGSIWSH